MRTKRFEFGFAVSDEFIEAEPELAAKFIEEEKADIARVVSAIGPRGGTYRLIADEHMVWRSDDGDSWRHGMRRFWTKRTGVYVRPSRLTPELRVSDGWTFRTFTIPVRDGSAILPSGKRVQTSALAVDIPVLSR